MHFHVTSVWRGNRSLPLTFDQYHLITLRGSLPDYVRSLLLIHRLLNVPITKCVGLHLQLLRVQLHLRAPFQWSVLPLQITLQIPGAYNLFVDLPIVIGTVPLRSRPPHYRTLGLPSQPQIHFYPAAPPYSEADTDDPLPVERKTPMITMEEAELCILYAYHTRTAMLIYASASYY